MNNNRFVQSKLFYILCTIIITTVIVSVVIPYISSKTSSWGTAEIAIVISVVAILAQFAPPFIETRLKKQGETYYTIHLDVTVLECGNVQFDVTIRNEGLVTILPKYTKLYIDQGIEGTSSISSYDFPFILEHKEHNNGNDCILCNRCKAENGENSFPIDVLPEKFKSAMRNDELEYECFPLDHLSAKSIKYIRAHEQFQENIILKFLKKGVYRATLVVITENADCQCATEQFFVNVPSQ